MISNTMNLKKRLNFCIKSPFGGFRGLLFFFLFLTFSCQKEEKAPVGMNKITIGSTTVGTISYTTATVSAAIETIKGNKAIQFGHCWGTAKNPVVEASKTTLGSLSEAKIVTSQLGNLLPNTSYFIRAYVTTQYETIYGAETTFKTIDYTKPTVITIAISGTTPYLAVSGGNVTADGGLPVTARGVVWNTTTEPTITSKIGISTDGTGVGSFTSQITNLLPATTYYLRSYATNSKDTGYGESFTFTTKSISAPEVTTTTISGTTINSAVSGGNVTSDGWIQVTARGVIWNTTGNPSLSNKIGMTTNGTGTGPFTSQIINLQPATSYYVRSYATNSMGTSYGNELSFQTKFLSLASLSTSIPSNIFSTSATLGGNVTSDGNATVTERGICYSTNTNPTMSNSKIAIGSGTGSFSNTITGLTASTTYYVRAYATNNQGTAYGNEVSFKTDNETVTDVDGNVYHTVTIGTQVWMVENLKTTKYNDGTAIPLVTSLTVWASLSAPAYCWYNNEATNKSAYGALYNWYTINTGKLCPIGWHVPTKAEWTTLIDYLGGLSIAGNNLKESGTAHWNSPNTGATNSTGFTALPGGNIFVNSLGQGVESINYFGYWWSSTEYESGTPGSCWIVLMDYQTSTADNRGVRSKRNGNSVRCIKD